MCLQLDELAVLALKRMAIDIRNEVTVHYTQDTHSTNEETFIASAISPEQQVSVYGLLSLLWSSASCKGYLRW